ncbi:unnamed protein product [Microthlaspi erraticum]|uniref:Arf-GAP domain-containing protein n=1 Tax=Microthlaspi erraticum TaxID=1685480 RepID=A0A6D2I6S2_9BRAS|nr:unnamed protein product [Microthlaspi erraticum]
MGSRMKEDERTEKAIRSLLKLPENRRCINCNSLGPQYVCATFWTFVCINCSGIHREFTHRVKSVSMAKFTAEEVNALRAGGNERGRQIYFKEWDAKRDAYPDGSNIRKLRDFIKSVYVDKRYTSESNDKISRQKPDVIEDYKESKKASGNFLGSRSLQSLDKYESERASAVGRSGKESLKFYFEDKKQQQQQQHVAHNPKARGLPKSPIRFEIVDDRFRDDGSVKRYDVRRDLRGNSKSLDLSNNKDTPSFPIVRHASEVLGNNGVKVEKKKDPVNNQMTASSEKMKNPRSLMDDEPVSEPSDDSIRQTSSELTASVRTTEAPAPNSLEALLFGLYDPSVASGTNNLELWNTSDISSIASVDNYPAASLETQIVPRTPDSVTSFVTSPTIAHAQSPHAADNLNTNDMATPSFAETNQVVLFASLEGPSSDTSIEQSTLYISNSAHGVGSEHHHQDETKASIRSALPEDLFSGGFSFASPQVHAHHHGMGYGMQYYQYPASTGAYTYSAKPSNPFDISCDDTDPNQAPQYPSMAYVHGGGLPHVSAPSGYSDSSNPAADSMALMPFQSPYYTTDPNLSPGAYMVPQSHVNMSPSFRGQEINGAHTFHQANSGYPSANVPNAYISRGNPFD